MPTRRSTQIIFLTVAIVFELFLAFASTFYVSWHSASFLFIGGSLVISVSVLVYSVVTNEAR